jgi:Ca2+-binding RTX toxin-like protein
MFNVDMDMKRLYKSEFKLVPFTLAITVIILYIVPDQTSWAAIIDCPTGASLCNGTPSDDVIIGTNPNAIIHGLDGNVYIIGDDWRATDMYGDNGVEILIGGNFRDGLYGGNGSDKYDGKAGDDTIVEYIGPTRFLMNNEIISGGEGNDWISAGRGSDTINGGPGDDVIDPNPPYRDFSYDSVDCGSGYDVVGNFYSGDKETAMYCEYIYNKDG